MQRFAIPKWWSAFAGGCAKLWRRISQWKGWKRICFLPLTAVIPLFILAMAALLWVFLQHWEHWLNLGTGCTVCLLTAAMGVYMIRRANREIRK